MLAVSAGMFLAALDQTIISTALPKISSEFNGLSSLSWVITAYLLTSTISVPISGKLSDIFGRRKLLLIGIVVFIVSSAMAGLSQNMAQLIAFRAIQGIGAGILMSNAFAVIGDLFTPAERGRWQGIIGAVFGLASIVGPLLGGYLTDNASWRWNFYLNIPVGFVAFFLITKLMPTIAPTKKHSIDYLGAGLLAAGLSALMLALISGGNQHAWTSAEIIGLFIASAITLFTFGWIEKTKAKDPILPLDLFDNSIYRTSMLIVFLVGLAMFGAILYIPLFAQDVLGRSATSSGIIIMPMVLSMVSMSVITGQIISKTGKYKKTTIFGLAMITIGLLSLSTISAATSSSQLAIRMIITGIGLGVAMPVFNLVVQNAFTQSRLGVASASVQLFRSIGATVGVALMGSILNNRLAQHINSVANDTLTKPLSLHAPNVVDLSRLDTSQVQDLLSVQGQHLATAKIARLNPSDQNPALQAYSHFVSGLKEALSSSIGEVFLIAGLLVSIAFFASWFLKEIPLRGRHADRHFATEGGVPGGHHHP